MYPLDHRGRGAGKTHGMIMALPHLGAVVLVPNSETAKCLSRMIEDLRGRDFLNRCRVTTVSGPHVFVGDQRPVRADHSFWENRNMSYWEGRQIEMDMDLHNSKF